jgi:hypothetical protein
MKNQLLFNMVVTDPACLDDSALSLSEKLDILAQCEKASFHSILG